MKRRIVVFSDYLAEGVDAHDQDIVVFRRRTGTGKFLRGRGIHAGGD